MIRLILTLSTLLLSACNRAPEAKELRVGWATAFAGLGQIVATAEKDSALSAFQFHRFKTGPEINEAAVRGKLDIIAIGIVPIAFLLARNSDWRIVARVYDFKLSTLVHPRIQAQSISDLKDLKVATGFGTGSHPYILSQFKAAGLDLKNSVQLLNISPTEQVQALEQGAVDAIAAFEPVTTILKTRLNARIIDQEIHSAYILVRKPVLDNHPEMLETFLQRIKEATLTVANNRPQADLLYSQISKVSVELLANMQEIESNFDAKKITEVNFKIDQMNLKRAQDVVEGMFEHALINKIVNLQDYVTQ